MKKEIWRQNLRPILTVNVERGRSALRVTFCQKSGLTVNGDGVGPRFTFHLELFQRRANCSTFTERGANVRNREVCPRNTKFNRFLRGDALNKNNNHN